MLFNLIFRNVKRKLQVYLIYFLSLSIIYALLYAFNAVPNHPVMGSLSGAKANMTNIFGQYMGILAYVIIMIIIFLVVYSTNFVLKRRKRIGFIFGLGMRTPKIVSILSFETLIINLLSLVLGLCVGTGFLSILAKIADIMFQSGYTGDYFILICHLFCS
ncbi:MAG: FtsX-like permease family protein [Streptococcus salivarius]